VGEAQVIQLTYKSRTAYLVVFAILSILILLQLSAVRGAEKRVRAGARANDIQVQ
jgi:hypothetical protein